LTRETHYEEARIDAVLDGRYRLRREIARGGQAVVFEAEHQVIGARVAVKTLIRAALDLPDTHARLIREARILGAVRHPNVVAIHDAGTCAAYGPYLVLEMIEGRPLDGILLTRQRLPVGQAVAILVQLCDALTEVHRHSIVHRDVKPGNVLIASTPAGDRVRLIDFGVTTEVADGNGSNDQVRKLTKSGEILGTVEYMAPEQLMGTSVTDARSDVYAAGVVLYECLTGEVPYSGPPTVVMANMIGGTRPGPLRAKRDDVPRSLEIVVFKALEIDPSKRYASCAEFARAMVASCGQAVPAIELLDVRDDRSGARQASSAAATQGEPDAGSRRRNYARAPYVSPGRILMPNGQSADGRTEDISEGGLLMVMEGACGDGQRVRVRLVVPVSGRVVELEGVTKWIKTRRNQLAIGVEFISAAEDVRADIRTYVALMKV
jgi:serine/threonine-protein kinase